MQAQHKPHTCCFFGHRKIEETTTLTETLSRTIENLIVTNNVDTFLFGSKSSFDDLCHKTVSTLKEKYPHIKRIYVRAEFPYINDDYKNYLLQDYEDTYFPPQMINAGKAAYIERNRAMIDNSNFCVIYYDESYAPPSKKRSKSNLTNYQPKSGTKLAFDYAVKKGIEIINIRKGNKTI